MEFWGVEVPSGKPLACEPGPESYVHVSQAALGENNSGKGSERVILKVKAGATEVVIGTLSHGKCDQTSLDLIFETKFVLSHNGGSSVYFSGYKTDAVKDDMGSSDEEDEFEDVSDEDDAKPMELAVKENGKAVVKPVKPEPTGNIKLTAKPLAAKTEVDVKLKEQSVREAKSKGAKAKGGDEDEDEDDDEEDDDDEAEGMSDSDSEDLDLDSDDENESDDEDDDESQEEEQPKSAGGKRPAPSVQKPNSAKKAKPVTPGKIDTKSASAPSSTPKQQQQSGKKDQSAKTTSGKENTISPSSGKKFGQFLCQPCKKNFNSESALTQHQAAKHK